MKEKGESYFRQNECLEQIPEIGERLASWRVSLAGAQRWGRKGAAEWDGAGARQGPVPQGSLGMLL